MNKIKHLKCCWVLHSLPGCCRYPNFVKQFHNVSRYYWCVLLLYLKELLVLSWAPVSLKKKVRMQM